MFSGARRDAAILCWDVRYTGECLYRLQPHAAASAQRIAFDIEPSGKLLFAGGTDGHVRVYDVAQGSLEREIVAAKDTVSCVSVHPTETLLLTASGHRRFVDIESDSDDSVATGGVENNVSNGAEQCSDAMRKRRRRTWQPEHGCNELAVWQLDGTPLQYDVAADGAAADNLAADVVVDAAEPAPGAALTDAQQTSGMPEAEQVQPA